jgi:hypothetical protein
MSRLERNLGCAALCVGLLGACAQDSTLTAAKFSSALSAQPDSDAGAGTWEHASAMPPFSEPAMATLDDRIVLVAADDEQWPVQQMETWEWDGSGWARRATNTAPSNSTRPSLARACDDRLILFGGSVGNYWERRDLDEVWQWKAGNWVQLQPAPGPLGRSHASVATLGKTFLMFGGQAGGSMLHDMWLWGAGTWLQRAPGPEGCTSPLATLGGRALLFCSARDADDHQGHTWIFDGNSWQEAQPATRPSNRYGHTLGRFGNRIVMFGGYADSGNWQETWEWDGGNWRDRTVSPSPPPSDGYQMTQLGDKLVLQGGGKGVTWAWDGEQWSIAASASMPTARRDYSIGTLGDAAVLFGGCCKPDGAGPRRFWDDTWQWDGQAWQELAPTHHPPGRAAAGLAAIGGKLVLFGGLGSDGVLADTWEWDGSDWVQRNVSGPAARQRHAMAAHAGKVVVLGGAGATSLGPDDALPDMWEWDGQHWREQTPSPGASVVPWGVDLGLASFAGELVLSPGYGNQLWFWNGSAWAARPTGDQPCAWVSPKLAVVDLGAQGTRLIVAIQSDWSYCTAEWDGATWRYGQYANSPELKWFGPMTALGDSVVRLSEHPMRTWVYRR